MTVFWIVEGGAAGLVVLGLIGMLPWEIERRVRRWPWWAGTLTGGHWKPWLWMWAVPLAVSGAGVGLVFGAAWSLR